MGRKGKIPNTREWIVRGLPYVVVYRIQDDAIVILAVFHSAQQRRVSKR
ncbi:MAG: type II toxin-antitoxin system RelE/ParE family toxin [Alphaproteobacteria bacterium]